MNWLLILVVLLVAGNIVWGFFRGFLRVVYSMAAWILILVFVTFATPYVADWMTEHTGLDTRIEKNCKEKLQNAVAGEEKSTEEQNTQEQKDLSGLGMKLPANVWNQIGDTHKLADGWMEQSMDCMGIHINLRMAGWSKADCIIQLRQKHHPLP